MPTIAVNAYRVFFCALAATCLLTACGQQSPVPKPAAQTETAPVPDDVQAAAEALLGTGAEVLVFGDLARTGKQQFLAVNRMLQPPSGAVPGTFVTRAIIAEDNHGKWAEILRCDEHLKNTRGYLGQTPAGPILGWRLEYGQDPEKGLQLHFTPLENSASSQVMPISVRWNPAAKRYQALDRDDKHFLPERPPIEDATSSLR